MKTLPADRPPRLDAPSCLDAPPSPGRARVRHGVLIGGVLVAASAGIWFALQHAGPGDVLEWAAAAKTWAHANSLLALLIFGMCVFLAAACAMPVGAPITAIGGYLFGGITAAAIASCCGTLGAITLYGMVRRLAGNPDPRRPASRFTRQAAEFRCEAASYLLFLRLSPTPFFLVTIAAALARVRLATFAWTTVLGILPGTLLHGFAGGALGASAAAQQHLYETCKAAQASSCAIPSPLALLADRATLMAFVAVGLVALLPVVVRKLFFRNMARRRREIPIAE